jgi:hypothetical protein
MVILIHLLVCAKTLKTKLEQVFTIPQATTNRVIKDLPRFVNVKGGGLFLFPVHYVYKIPGYHLEPVSIFYSRFLRFNSW